MTPRVSVIIIAHNEEGAIARSIQSVLDQTWRDFELILVDDASADRTQAVMRSFSDARIMLHARSMASGAAAARNAGIGIARAEWIAFLDADDVWHPEKLAKQMDVAAVGHADAVLCGFRLFRDANPQPEIHLNNLPQPWPAGIVTGCHFCPGSGLMIKKTCFEKLGGFNETLRRLEDWEWWLRAANAVRCENVSQPLIDIFVDRPPSYSVVLKACNRLRAECLGLVTRQYGAANAVRFWITLQFECATVAYRNKLYFQFIRHLLCGGAGHFRFWRKICRAAKKLACFNLG